MRSPSLKDDSAVLVKTLCKLSGGPEQRQIRFAIEIASGSSCVTWPAPGFEDTEIGVFMEPEVDHGETKIYAGVQA